MSRRNHRETITSDPIADKYEAPHAVPPVGERDSDRRLDNEGGNGRKWIAGAVVTAIVAGGGYLGYNKLTGGGSNPDEARPDVTAGAPAKTGEKLAEMSRPQVEKILADLDGQTTDEQVQWVIDNPVVTANYKTPEEVVSALSARLNAISNSARLDLDQPVGENGHYPFTADFQPKFDAMVETVYDTSSDGYDTLYTALETVTQNYGSYIGNAIDVKDVITPNEGTTVLENNTIVTEALVDTISRSNSDLDEGAGVAAFEISIDDQDIARVAHTQEL